MSRNYRRGTKHGNAKFDVSDLRNIWRMALSGAYYIKDIAKRYKCDPRTIKKIIRGESYVEESVKLDELGELDYPKKKNIWIEKLEEGE